VSEGFYGDEGAGAGAPSDLLSSGVRPWRWHKSCVRDVLNLPRSSELTWKDLSRKTAKLLLRGVGPTRAPRT
jgi:hypothetical protein